MGEHPGGRFYARGLRSPRASLLRFFQARFSNLRLLHRIPRPQYGHALYTCAPDYPCCAADGLCCRTTWDRFAPASCSRALGAERCRATASVGAERGRATAGVGAPRCYRRWGWCHQRPQSPAIQSPQTRTPRGKGSTGPARTRLTGLPASLLPERTRVHRRRNGRGDLRNPIDGATDGFDRRNR